MRLRHLTGTVVFLSVLALPALTFAQTPPLAPVFQVNSFTTDDQYGYGVAMDKNGNFVVTWESYLQDGSSYGVEGRRFDSTGTPFGAEFQVNQHTTSDQGYPRVASDPQGNFIVAWQSDGQDGVGPGIFARRYDKSGTALGSEFQVNTYTSGYQTNPSVATDAGGNFVVTWQSASQDGSGLGVFGQRYDNSGTKVGSEFPVNTYTTGDQATPYVAMDATGNFVVVWHGQGASSADAIFGRRFTSAGVGGAEFQVSTATSVAYPAVAMDKAGEFVIAYEGYVPGGSGRDAVARRYTAAAAPVGAEFRVNTTTTGDQFSPDVALDPNGNFIVAWESPDGDSSGILAQRFDRLGNFVGSEFALNTYTTGAQLLPTVATSPLGNFVVSWSSFGQDGSNYGVFARTSVLQAAPAIAVDAHASSGPSDLNSVLEPGETVLVETGWTNTGSSTQSFTGSSPSFSGPPGATYTLVDAAADYGSVNAGATNDCFTATANCYEVSVSNPGTRPAGHWDTLLQENLSAATPKTWTLHVGHSFTDVPTSQPFYKRIEALLHSGITAGCTPTQYCPNDQVSRGQMSLFIGRGIAGSGAAIPLRGKVNGTDYNCTAGGTSIFTDVAPDDITCKSVHYIAAQNVTLGCSPTQYCPTSNVKRIEMAAFVAKAIVAPQGGAGVPVTYTDPVTHLHYSCDAGSPDTHFTDVTASNVFCKHVHYLWAKGVVTGCTATQYCPDDPVTRDAMSKFLGAAFNLQLYGP